MQSDIYGELSFSKQDKRANIPWLLLFIISLFEFVFDYSRFSFVNKHVIFLSVLIVCLAFVFFRKIIIRRESASLYILLLFCFFSMLIFNFDFTYLMYWIALAITIGYPLDQNNCEKVRKLLVFFGTFMALSCIVQLLFPDFFYTIGKFYLNDSWEQLAKTFASWNSYPGLSYQTGNTASIIAIAIAAYFSFFGHRKKKWFSLIIVVILYAGMVLTSKRMMFIVSLVIPFVCYMGKMTQKGEKISKRILALIGVLLVFVVAFSIALPYMEEWNVFQRFMNDDLGGNGYTSGRISLYENAWNQFLNNPIFGIGWGNFAKMFGTSVHNVFLQLLAESGFVGFFLCVFIFASLFLSTIRAVKMSVCMDHEIKSGVLLSLALQVVFFLDCMTGNPLYNISMITTYFFAVHIALSMKYLYNSELKRGGQINE